MQEQIKELQSQNKQLKETAKEASVQHAATLKAIRYNAKQAVKAIWPANLPELLESLEGVPEFTKAAKKCGNKQAGAIAYYISKIISI